VIAKIAVDTASLLSAPKSIAAGGFEMKRSGLLFCALFIFVFLIGCSSFPTLKAEDDTLLIIPTFFLKQTSPILFGEYHAKISNINVSSISVDVLIDPTKLYQVVQGLPEGDYIIPEYHFLYNTSKTGGTYPASIIFSMQKGTITFLPKTFQYTQKGDGHTFTYYGGWTTLTKEKISELYESLSKEQNFASWKLSEKTSALVEQAKNP
jgi:hypothetical protein